MKTTTIRKNLLATFVLAGALVVVVLGIISIAAPAQAQIGDFFCDDPGPGAHLMFSPGGGREEYFDRVFKVTSSPIVEHLCVVERLNVPGFVTNTIPVDTNGVFTASVNWQNIYGTRNQIFLDGEAEWGHIEPLYCSVNCNLTPYYILTRDKLDISDQPPVPNKPLTLTLHCKSNEYVQVTWFLNEEYKTDSITFCDPDKGSVISVTKTLVTTGGNYRVQFGTSPMGPNYLLVGNFRFTLADGSTPVATASPTATTTSTPSATPDSTSSATPTPTNTPIQTNTPTQTPTSTSTPTATPTQGGPTATPSHWAFMPSAMKP